MSNKKFTVTVWKNCRRDIVEGAVFGISIPREVQSKVFEEKWNSINLRIEGNEVVIGIKSNFWTTCNELRDPAIRDWVIKHGLETWEPGCPRRVCLTHIGRNIFEISLIRY